MKFKSLIALALTLATIGLSLPAVADDKNDNQNRPNSGYDNSRHHYYGKYHYYQLSSGDYIYIGEHGDYWDSSKEYHKASDNPSYKDFYDSHYNWRKGDYYYHGKYYSKRGSNRN